jgi:uncharacterized membrane protein
MGNLPITVTLRPDDEPRIGNVTSTLHLRAQIVSDVTDADCTANLLVRSPDGWSATPSSRRVTVPAGGHITVPIAVTIPDTATSGWYAVAAGIDHEGQDLQDVLIVPVGQAPPEPLLRARSETDELTLAAGTRGVVRVQVTHTLRTPLHGHVQLIAPHHIWPLVNGPTRSFTMPPSSTTHVEFPVTVPATAPPGEFWVQPKICAYGHITYSEPIRVHIGQ